MKNTRVAFLRNVSFAAALIASTAIPANAALLSIIHNNDGESNLTPSAGSPTLAAEFVTGVNTLRNDRLSAGRDVITLSSGDNFLAGPGFTASLNDGIFYDARLLSAIQYDAILLGNHDFDFGTSTLASFIGEVQGNVPYLSANLDFSTDANLAGLIGTRLFASTIIERGGERYGVVGATTDSLASISSPGNVTINPVVAAVQAEVDALEAAGVNKIILASHLQEPSVDLATIAQLRGIDIVIAGGSDVNLSNSIPGAAGPYPQFSIGGAPVLDADGNNIPLVTTAGSYTTIGVLDVEFDAAGKLINISASSDGIANSGFAPDADVVTNVLTPVQAAAAGFAANIIGTTEIELNGVRDNVRTKQTAFGSVIADAFIWAAERENAANPGLLSGAPVISLQNGGGIRNDVVIAAGGTLSELDTLNALAFSNILSVLNGVTTEDLKTILEFSIARLPGASGRFGQVGGLSFEYNPLAPSGSRLLRITLADGTLVYADGFSFYDGTFDLVTNNFTAADGDGYPFSALGLEFTNFGIGYQRALFEFVEDELDGVIAAARFGGSESRIAQVSEPSTMLLLSLGVAGVGLMAGRRRRKAAK